MSALCLNEAARHALPWIAELQAAWQSGEPVHAGDSAKVIDVLYRLRKVGTAYCCKHTHYVLHASAGIHG